MGDAFAAAEKKLHGPEMSHHHGEQSQTHDPGVSREMPRRPNSESSFPNITENGQEKTGPAKAAPHIFRANTAASEFADIQSFPESNQVIAGGDTAQPVGP